MKPQVRLTVAAALVAALTLTGWSTSIAGVVANFLPKELLLLRRLRLHWCACWGQHMIFPTLLSDRDLPRCYRGGLNGKRRYTRCKCCGQTYGNEQSSRSGAPKWPASEARGRPAFLKHLCLSLFNSYLKLSEASCTPPSAAASTFGHVVGGKQSIILSLSLTTWHAVLYLFHCSCDEDHSLKPSLVCC